MGGWITTTFFTLFGVVMGSSGFWAWYTHREKRRSASTRLLMGLASVELSQRGMSYVERGWITKDEFEEFRILFYEPYKAIGGNGLVDRIMHAVESLPLKNPPLYVELSNPRREQEKGYDRKPTEGVTRASIEQPFL
jgi:hypothetical protein